MRKISGKNICPSKKYLDEKKCTTLTDTKDIANKHTAAFTENTSSAHYGYIPGHKGARADGQNWLHLRQHGSLQQTFPIERLEAVSNEGQTWTWRDPEQSVEPCPCGHTEDPKRNPKQDMDLGGFPSSMESSNSDPDSITKQEPYWPTQL